MSLNDSDLAETKGAVCSAIGAEASVINNDADRPPMPFPEDEHVFVSFDQGNEEAGQSLGHSASGKFVQADTEGMDEGPKSAFSDDSSGGSSLWSPVDLEPKELNNMQEQQNPDTDLWTDDDEEEAPPPRPAAPLAASDYEKERVVVYSKLPDLDREESIFQRKAWEIRLKASPGEQSTGRRDRNAAYVKSPLNVVSRPDSPNQDTGEGDELSPETAQHVARAPHNMPATHPTTETQAPAARPESPITEIYTVKDALDYYAVENEHDRLLDSVKQAPSSSKEARVEHSADDSSETPPTPTSADALEEVTGMFIQDDAQQRFDRLVELANTPVMQNPQRALEMKRQMLLYSKLIDSDAKYRISAEGTKSTLKAKLAFSSAAAHLYRQQREKFKQSAWDWEDYGRNEHKVVQSYKECYHEVNRERAEFEQAADAARDELDACRKEKEELEKETQDLRKRKVTSDRIYRQVLPLYEKQKKMEQNPPKEYGSGPSHATNALFNADIHHSFGTQTSPTISYDDVDTQTSPSIPPQEEAELAQLVGEETTPQDKAETDHIWLSESDKVIMTIDRGTQTLHISADGTLQSQTGRPSRTARASIPRLPFDIDASARANVVTEIVNWVNHAHEYERGDPDVSPVTKNRVDELIDRGTFYNDFVSALESDGLLFRPDHLARHVEDFMNEQRLNPIPPAILQQNHDISSGNLEGSLRSVYNEIAERQEQISELQRQHNQDEGAMAEMKTTALALQFNMDDTKELQALISMLQDQVRVSEQNFQQATDAVEDLAKQKSELTSLLKESRATEVQLVNNRTQSPSQRSESSEQKNAGNGISNLTKDLGAYQEQTVRLSKSLDDADSEGRADKPPDGNAASDEIKRLLEENAMLTDEEAGLVDENTCYNCMLNQAAQLSQVAQDKTTPSLKIATNLPLPVRSPAIGHPGISSAIPLPVTPPTNAASALPPSTDNTLLRPTDVFTTPAAPPPPVDAATLPPAWLERERRLQGTAAFRAPRARVWAAIQQREHLDSMERELRTEKARLEAKIEAEARRRAGREEEWRLLDEQTERAGEVVMVGEM